ncbi:hypothetical protein CC80DRAFT_567623 [Byssothecium circinans]|uniref:Uncharacterized protein n=1 Tax=Byssothecium circinans TaxID=147558 RepID=A0A6A5TNV2_9PLEO|nr:hypothetical protein CC80DRAFT_567623 [Byssothecium circinans]
METDVEDIVGLVHDLNVADDASQDPGHGGQGPLRSTCSSLQDSVHMLIQSTNTITSQSQTVNSLANDTNSSGNLSIADVCSLRGAAKRLTDISFSLQRTIDALNEATERSVIIRLRSLGSPIPTTVFKILSHFDKQIKDIIREVLNNTSDRDVLWKVAEECYKQAISRSGSLDADNYFVPVEEAPLGWPYDSDFESEEYYEHESRLEVDENYAAAFQGRIERRIEARRKDRQIWPEFWVRVLNNSPAGPTLFYPPASVSAQNLNFDSIPKYLFRTFNEASSGRNNESVTASMASIKSCFGGEKSDNLMSWTSSLLFAIQYAVWRHKTRGCYLSDIKICVVDTRKFPQGQFAQDIWLLNAYHETAEQLDDPRIRRFFKFRLENEDFYNGEYLSQGVLNHANRSCLVSLGKLVQAGLFQLYPEFNDPRGSEKWSKRVLELRQIWSAEQTTNDREIELALSVGRNCFPHFGPYDIASILLTFKNRKLSRLNLAGEKPFLYSSSGGDPSSSD